MKIIIPDNVKIIFNQLEINGFEAFAVGGCVRDSLLGLTPHDWDICTNAVPEQIKSCFTGFTIFEAGIKHGTISVVYDNNVYEITTYRIDGIYSDNRHPQNVKFTPDITEDLARRDFTVNAMAYNEKRGLVDPFNGQQDLEQGIIRCVGNADKRFNEDALRIIRALRFASVYKFDIEEKTSDSLLKNSQLLNNIAVERISAEFIRLLCGDGAEEVLNRYREVFAVFIPELECEFDYNQHSKHHNLDLWHHTTRTISSIEPIPELRMTMLLHDLGKPECCKTDPDGTCHFKGHPAVSAKIAEKILHRLKFPNDFIKTFVTLVTYHDERYTGSVRQLRRLLNKIGEDNLRALLKVQRADINAQSDYMKENKLQLLCQAEMDLNNLLEADSCFSLKQLAVNGSDLIGAGITDGKQIGKILNTLLEMVIDDKIENIKSDLLEKAVDLSKYEI